MYAKDYLEKACKDAGMELYEGRYDSKKRTYLGISYTTTCDEKNGRNKCKAEARGRCISKAHESLYFRCGDGVLARGAMVRSGSHVLLLMGNGSKLTLDLRESDKKLFEDSVKQVCPQPCVIQACCMCWLTISGKR